MEERPVIIGTFGAGLLGLALVLTLSWLLSIQPRGAALRGRLSSILCPPPPASHRPGLDTGLDAIKLVEAWDGLGLLAPNSPHLAPSYASGSWVRLRGIDLKKVPETRQALLKLRVEGLRTCVFLRRSVKDWKVAYLPDDLHEVYAKGRQLGAAFGDLVDAWEVDNEPDLGFVPESAERYTAFLKATYLGLKAGSKEHGAGSQNNLQGPGFSPQVSLRAPLVIMGSLGLPPGPWLERFAANDGFAYTDGYNYHYYGYAEDFTSVYRQHKRAVAELTTKCTPSNCSANSASSVLKKDWPVFLTEIGYGMLGKQARDTKEGRMRQWRWFKSVGEQIAQLQIEGAMAFYLLPYLEYNTSEYGMTVAPSATASAKSQAPSAESEPPSPSLGAASEGQRTDMNNNRWVAGGIEYSPSDFGAEKASPWMATIGQKIGGNEATPALAWWLASRRSSGYFTSVSPSENRGLTPAGQQAGTVRPQVCSAISAEPPPGFAANGSRSWSVTTSAPSPVVIDFLPDTGLSLVKRYQGSFVTGTATSIEQKAKSKEPVPPLPPRPSPSATPRREEFIIQVRTKNGNLYEVYPTRQATQEWQHFMEPHANFTMSFYGRAELPWRFSDNRPASLVVVMYPKQLPAVFEFRHPMLTRLGKTSSAEIAEDTAKAMRYGRGKVVLYNFSDKSVTGRLFLPDGVTTEPTENTKSRDSANSASSVLMLSAGKRREVQVSIQVAAQSYTLIDSPISFVPEDTAIPPARFLTAFIPDIGGMKATVIGSVLNRAGTDYTENTEIIRKRPRAIEEAPMIEQGWALAQGDAQISGLKSQASGFTAYAQPGAVVERTAAGLTVTITAIPSSKPQRIEVEIPWPGRLDFPPDAFLSLEFRLR